MTAKTSEARTELVKRPEAAPLANTSPAASSLLEVIERAARDPNVDIEKMERLFALMEKGNAATRAAAYADAMALCQAEIPRIQKTGLIAHNGKTISRFAKLEDIDHAIRPITSKHGFSLAFNSQALENGKTRYTLKVTHREGHFETFEFDAAPDKSGAKNAIQELGSATSYARRYLTKGAFNIVETDDDDDGAATGKPNVMTAEHIAHIKQLLKDARDAGLPGFEDAKILNWKRVLAFDELRDEEYEPIVAAIKERRAEREGGARR